MTVLALTGMGVLAPVGEPAVSVAGLGPFPAGTTLREVPGFDVRTALGRKGTSTFDRLTGMSVLTVGRAITDAGLAVADLDAGRTGIVLGTTAGGVRTTVEFCMETFTSDRPHLVNPALFPTTVMNCPAGQAAIWYGLRGVNATLAGGPLSMITVLRYCRSVLRARRADRLLAGSAEELSPYTARMASLVSPGCPPEVGEGAAVFVVEQAVPGRACDGEVLDVVLGFAPPGTDRRAALDRAVLGALRRNGVPDDAVVDRRDGADPAWGECLAAGGALRLAGLLAEHRADPGRDGRCAVLTATSPEGAIGVVVVRGWSRADDRG